MAKDRQDSDWKERFEGAEMHVPEQVWHRIAKEVGHTPAFEKQIASKLNEAKITPSTGVWEGIQHHLDFGQLDAYRKKMSLYRLAAAISLLLAFTFALLYFTQSNEQNTELSSTTSLPSIQNTDEALAKSQLDKTNESSVLGSKQIPELENKSSNDHEQSISGLPVVAIVPSARQTDDQYADLQQATPPPISITKDEQLLLANDNLGDLAKMSAFEKKEGTPDVDSEQALKQLFNLPDGNKEKPAAESKFLASLGAGAGQFNPNITTNYDPRRLEPEALLFNPKDDAGRLVASNAAPAPTEDDYLLSVDHNASPQLSFGISGELGFRITPRFMVISGLGYNKYTYTSRNANIIRNLATNDIKPLSLTNVDYEKNKFNEIDRTTPYALEHQFAYFAIPVKAGYMLLDKRFNIMVTAGISTEFFLRNQAFDQSQLFREITHTTAEDSPFKPVFFNVMGSLELGYSLGANYQIMVAPSYRKAISDFARPDASFSSRPSTISIIGGIRYIF